MKLNYDEPLSNFAVNLKLRPYSLVVVRGGAITYTDSGGGLADRQLTHVITTSSAVTAAAHVAAGPHTPSPHCLLIVYMCTTAAASSAPPVAAVQRQI